MPLSGLLAACLDIFECEYCSDGRLYTFYDTRRSLPPSLPKLRRGWPEANSPLTITASVLCHKYAAFQRVQNRRGQGAVRSECLDIGKGRNTAIGGFTPSRRARRTRPVAALRPLPICSILAASRALPQALCGTLKGSVFVTQDTRTLPSARSAARDNSKLLMRPVRGRQLSTHCMQSDLNRV